MAGAALASASLVLPATRRTSARRLRGHGATKATNAMLGAPALNYSQNRMRHLMPKGKNTKNTFRKSIKHTNICICFISRAHTHAPPGVLVTNALKSARGSQRATNIYDT